MAYYVYVLCSERDGSYYVGYTSDVEKRLTRHNCGRSPYTKAKLPWNLIYQEVFSTRSEAMKREKKIKGMKNRGYIGRLIRASQA